ncbi:MAG: hypothetical protein VXW43_11050, partial [Pseudomonadota bacterium]|nr:hypothetical protein [Pseudomonadota bacterium]
MLTEIWVPLLGGLVLLILGGDFLVRGAVQVAERLGVSPLVIGLTLVGFGTSMPELVTSVRAALSGAPGIAYGNIVGSNIANILLIVGASALVTPVVVARAALRAGGWSGTCTVCRGCSRRTRCRRTGALRRARQSPRLASSD